jgi:hypothetical protein
MTVIQRRLKKKMKSRWMKRTEVKIMDRKMIRRSMKMKKRRKNHLNKKVR